jgi:hypothetical protein
MPSKNDDDEQPPSEVDLHALPPPPPPNPATLLKTNDPDETTIIETTVDVGSTLFAELYSAFEDMELEEDFDELFEEDERFFQSEERFFTKTLNRKFIARGYKRPPESLRLAVRRKYQNFREVKREDKRKIEKFRYVNCLDRLHHDRDDHVQNEQWNVPKTNPISTSTSCPPASTTATATSDPVPPGSRYLSVNQEQEYQEALRQTSAELTPSTGISLQQMLEMLNRDLTPEDYELLLRLDEAVEKKTVNQETITTLTEKKIEDEAHLSEICTICMFNYEMGENVKFLPCNHFFHVDCIVPYLSSYGQACPVCKAKV